jgi:hypothetical protein
VARSLDLDELVEHWTLLDDEQKLIAGKRGPTRLGFALVLKFYAPPAPTLHRQLSYARAVLADDGEAEDLWWLPRPPGPR